MRREGRAGRQDGYDADHSRVTGRSSFLRREAADSREPAELLERAWALEPPLLLAQRRAVLETLAEVLDQDEVPDAPPGRDWRLELLGELAVDASTHVRLEEVVYLTDQIREAAHDAHAEVALARASWARGRALAWAGTEAAASEGARELARAAERFGAIGRTDWQGYTLIWHGHTIHYENGRPQAAAEMIRAGLELLSQDSPWRATGLVFLADVQLELGELDATEASLEAAAVNAELWADAKARSYVSWNAAHLAAARGDPHATERLLAQVEREGGEWFESHLGVYFLADAAALLDSMGLTGQARHYLDLAQARGSIDDDYVVLARAVMLARSGDPHLGEEKLQQVARNEWVEKRLIWRNTLLLAWSTLRAGARADAGRVTRRAFDQAVGAGGMVVAQTAEPLITTALAPLAEEAGCAHARGLLLPAGGIMVRLFGTTAVSDAAGRVVELPAGMPGELVRMLAVSPGGIPVDIVLETFFPDATLAAARQRLRQLLSRIRANAGDIVLRDGELLALAPAWVDTRAFSALTAQARAYRGALSLQYAHAALALAGRGPLLPSYPYAQWAEEARDLFAHAQAALELIVDSASR